MNSKNAIAKFNRKIQLQNGETKGDEKKRKERKNGQNWICR